MEEYLSEIPFSVNFVHLLLLASRFVVFAQSSWVKNILIQLKKHWVKQDVTIWVQISSILSRKNVFAVRVYSYAFLNSFWTGQEDGPS